MWGAGILTGGEHTTELNYDTNNPEPLLNNYLGGHSLFIVLGHHGFGFETLLGYRMNFIKSDSLINIGSGQEFKIKKFAEIINEITFSKKKLKFNKKLPDGTKRKVLDISIIKKLGWRSKIKLTDGLRSTINWYKSNTTIKILFKNI